jgi:hypothetical protein
MPRGGRRPGAGAPKGNFNAVTTGNNSMRLLLVGAKIMILKDDLTRVDERARLKQIFIESGCFPLPTRQFNGDLKRLVEILWREWFDSHQSTQSNAIKDLPRFRAPRPSARRRETQSRAELQRLLRQAKNAMNLIK